MTAFLVTGGLGPLGLALARRLVSQGHTVVSVDEAEDTRAHPSLLSVRADPHVEAALEARVFRPRSFETVFHCAPRFGAEGALPGGARAADVDAARTIATLCARYGAGKIVFPSAALSWGGTVDAAVPVIPSAGGGAPGSAVGGESEAASLEPSTSPGSGSPLCVAAATLLAIERVFATAPGAPGCVVLRFPTLVGPTFPASLLALFETLDGASPARLRGVFEDPCQLLWIDDAVDACLRASNYGGTGTFHVAAPAPVPFARALEDVSSRVGAAWRVKEESFLRAWIVRGIARATAGSRGPSVPLEVAALRKPGPVFDCSATRSQLGWESTADTAGTLALAYEAWKRTRNEERPEPTWRERLARALPWIA